jgi:hypothetical protein
MATEQKRILVRRGNKADLVVTDLQPGELVLALDTNEIGVKTSGGTVLWFATLDANGKAKQDPASYGKAGGAATLDANGKLVQMPSAADVGAPSIPTIISQPFVLNNTTGDWTGSASGALLYAKIGCLVKFYCLFYVSNVGNGGNMMFTLPKEPKDYYQFTAYKAKIGTNDSRLPESQFIFANPFRTAICRGFTSSGSDYQIATGAYYCHGSYFTDE